MWPAPCAHTRAEGGPNQSKPHSDAANRDGRVIDGRRRSPRTHTEGQRTVGNTVTRLRGPGQGGQHGVAGVKGHRLAIPRSRGAGRRGATGTTQRRPAHGRAPYRLHGVALLALGLEDLGALLNRHGDDRWEQKENRSSDERPSSACGARFLLCPMPTTSPRATGARLASPPSTPFPRDQMGCESQGNSCAWCALSHSAVPPILRGRCNVLLQSGDRNHLRPPLGKRADRAMVLLGAICRVRHARPPPNRLTKLWTHMRCWGSTGQPCANPQGMPPNRNETVFGCKTRRPV